MSKDATVFRVQAIAAKRVVLARCGNVAEVVVGSLFDVSAFTPMFTLRVVREVVQVVNVHVLAVAAFGALLWVRKVPVVVWSVAAMALAHVWAGMLVNKACLVHLVVRKRAHFISSHSWTPRGVLELSHVIRLTETGTDTAVITRRRSGGC